MGLNIVRTLPREQWHNYVQQHPQGNIFHSPEMFDLFSQLKNHVPQLWAAVHSDGSIQALMTPIQITLKDGGISLLRQLTTRAVAYGSVLHEATPLGQEALAMLLQSYNQSVGKEVIFTELRNLADLTAAQPILEQHGFAFEGHLNYLINLDLPLEQVMEAMGKRLRKQIRSGLNKKQVIVQPVNTVAEVREVYDLILKSYTAAQVHLSEWEFFEGAFNALSPQGMITFWLARFEGQSVAASIELPYKKTLYGWYSGVDREFSKYYPGELLMWHVLEWGVQHGYTIYDFGGAGKPDEEYGVREFKAKFGGELVNYGRNSCVHRPKTLQISKLGYEIYRRFR